MLKKQSCYRKKQTFIRSARWIGHFSLRSWRSCGCMYIQCTRYLEISVAEMLPQSITEFRWKKNTVSMYFPSRCPETLTAAVLWKRLRKTAVGIGNLHKRGRRLASTIWLLINRAVMRNADSTIENYRQTVWRVGVASGSCEKRGVSHCLNYLLVQAT